MNVKKLTALLIVLTLLPSPVRSSGGGWGWDVKWYEYCCIIIILPIERALKTREKYATETVVAGGVKLKVRRESIYRYDGPGQPFQSGTLVSSAVIPVGSRKIKFGPGHIRFSREGHLLGGTLHRKTSFLIGGEEVLLAPRLTQFSPQGTVLDGTLAGNTRLKAGEKRLLISAANVPQIYFPDGPPFHLSEGNVSFYPDGNLRSGRLAEKALLSTGKYEIAFTGGETLLFSEKGLILAVFPDGNLTVVVPCRTLGSCTSQLKFHRRLYFHENGEIKSGNLAEPETARIKGNTIHIPESTDLYYPDIAFHENGILKTFTTAKPMTVMAGDKTYSLGGRLYFYPDGAIRGGALNEDALLPVGRRGARSYKVQCRKGYPVEFYPNGSLKKGTLAGDFDSKHYSKIKNAQRVYINGKRALIDWFLAETYFHENGEVHSICTYYRGDGKNEYLLNGGRAEIQRFEPIMFSDFEKGIVEGVGAGIDDNSLSVSHVRVPGNIYNKGPLVKIPRKRYGINRYVWIKYGRERWGCCQPKVEALQFAEDITIEVDGKKRFCRAFTWVSLTE